MNSLISKIALGAVLLTNLSAIAQTVNTVAEQANLANLAKTNKGISNVRSINDQTTAFGGVATGGGNSMNSKMIESYLVQGKSFAAYQKVILPMLMKLDEEYQISTDGGRPKTFVTYYGGWIQSLQWYMVPASLKPVAEKHTGIPFRSMQIAAQNIDQDEVFIDAAAFRQLSLKEQATLIIHEMFENMYGNEDMGKVRKMTSVFMSLPSLSSDDQYIQIGDHLIDVISKDDLIKLREGVEAGIKEAPIAYSALKQIRQNYCAAVKKVWSKEKKEELVKNYRNQLQAILNMSTAKLQISSDGKYQSYSEVGKSCGFIQAFSDTPFYSDSSGGFHIWEGCNGDSENAPLNAAKARKNCVR